MNVDWNEKGEAMNGFAGSIFEYMEQLIKYGLAGLAAAAADIGLLYALTEWGGVYYLLSASISFCLGVVVNYAVSTRFVFKKRKISGKNIEFVLFFAIGAVGLLLNLLLIWLLTEKFNLYYIYSKYAAVAAVFLFNFNARRFILFS